MSTFGLQTIRDDFAQNTGCFAGPHFLCGFQNLRVTEQTLGKLVRHGVVAHVHTVGYHISAAVAQQFQKIHFLSVLRVDLCIIHPKRLFVNHRCFYQFQDLDSCLSDFKRLSAGQPHFAILESREVVRVDIQRLRARIVISGGARSVAFACDVCKFDHCIS